MLKKIALQLSCSVFFTYNCFSSVEFNKLLTCNLSHINIAQFCNPQHELDLYNKVLAHEENYPTPTKQTKKTTYIFPNIHPTHQAVVDVIKSLSISSICEIGAGYGEVSKYIYYLNPGIALTCVEHNRENFRYLKEHFETNTSIILPDIQVKATLVNDSVPGLTSLQDNSYDLVFTCAVMMHIPFIPAVKAAQRIVNISKKYILHIENKNEGRNWYNMAVINPSSMSLVNKNGIDYPRLYESLGVKTIKYEEYKHPDCPGIYVVYLGEKLAK